MELLHGARFRRGQLIRHGGATRIPRPSKRGAEAKPQAIYPELPFPSSILTRIKHRLPSVQ